MPCWYYDRRELEQFCNHGLDPDVAARYRREGARFILDCGGKMGLRYETCATGVVYFHRFYLFHSFREFNRHVTAACCLFLAGKVEETPKKCKDIIKVARNMLTDQQFASFGDDPREEVMTMERILLQTIKFDLQVEHPYSYLLKFAKVLKGNEENSRDKDKIQAMVQMAWTFINDSMCTLLCLQWEPDIVAVALMYLASRLKTFEITEWGGKTNNSKGKWWNSLVEDITFELLEDICHQVLDLYSNPQQNQNESPPPPPPPKHPPSSGQHKRSRSTTPSEGPESHGLDRSAPPPSKVSRHEGGRSKSPSPTTSKHDKGNRHSSHHGQGTPVKSHPGSAHVSPQPASGHPAPALAVPTAQPAVAATVTVSANSSVGSAYPRPDGVAYNPYMTSGMYGSSFMSGEGAQSIQSLMSGGSSATQPSVSGVQNTPPVPTTAGPPAPPPTTGHYNKPPHPPGGQYTQAYQQPPPPYQSYSQPPPPQSSSYPPPPGAPLPPQPPYPPQGYSQPPPPQQQPPPPPQQQQPGYGQYQYPSYNQPPPPQGAPYPPPPQGYPPPPPTQKPPPPNVPPQQPPYSQPYNNPQYPPPPGGQYNYGPQNSGYQQQYQGAPPNGGYPVRGPPPPAGPPPPTGPPPPSGPPPPAGLPPGGPPPGPPTSAPTGLATVRITGRR